MFNCCFNMSEQICHVVGRHAHFDLFLYVLVMKSCGYFGSKEEILMTFVNNLRLPPLNI